MPLLTETEARKEAFLPVGLLPEEEQTRPPFSELFTAGLRVQNTLISGGEALGEKLEREQARTRARELGQAPYNAFEHIRGYEQWSSAFRDAQTPEEVEFVKRRIDKELEDREILEAGGAAGIAAQLAAGVLDPINLIPIGGSILKGGSILRGIARGAPTGAAAAALAEGALQASQLTRTAKESALNIGATAFLSGILGGAAPVVREALGDLASRVGREIEIPPPGKPDPLAPGGIALNRTDLASAGAAAVTRSEAKLKSALGVEKLVKFASPIMRATQSPSVATRRIAQELVETPFFYEDAALGVSTPIAAETRVKMWQAPLAQSLEEMDQLYARYRGGGGGLSFKQFREEVGRAMRRSDKHVIAEVAQAARSFRTKLFDPTKLEAIATRLLPENVQVVGAESYLSRVYDTQKINARRNEFVARLTQWLQSEHTDIDTQELREIAEQITDHILGVPEGRIAYEAIPLKRGPLKERVLDIPDTMIEDFLESDIQTIARFYARTIVPDIELARTFGDPTMRDAIGKVSDDYKDLIAAAKSEKERAALAKQRTADIRDLSAMRDRLRGTYGAPADPDAVLVRAGRVLRNWNYLSMLGSMTVSSVPDVARAVTVHGMVRTFKDGLIPLVMNFRRFKLSAEEAKRAGTALDMVLDSRAMELADVGDMYGRHSKFERGLQYLTENFGKVVLMTPWNAALKQFASVLTQDRIVEAALKGSNASRKEIEKLAMSGIDADTASRIAQQFRQFGSEEGGVKLANTPAWTDRQALEAFRAAIVKDADRIIVTPGIGDRPLWMSSETGKLVGQFRSFAVSATQKMLVSGLQQRDMAVLNGTLLSIVLGSGVYGLHSKGMGKEPSDDPAVWIREGVDRSGILGWLYEANNIVEKFSGGTIGLNRLTGGEPSLRYADRGGVGALLGPSFGRAEDIYKATSGAISGDFSESDARAFRRLVPYQNVFYLRYLFDQAQEGVQANLGVE